MANGRRTKGDGPSGDFAASTSRIDFASAPRRSRFKLFANFSERYGASNFRWCGRSTRNVVLFQFRLDTMQFFWPFFPSALTIIATYWPCTIFYESLVYSYSVRSLCVLCACRLLLYWSVVLGEKKQQYKSQWESSASGSAVYRWETRKIISLGPTKFGFVLIQQTIRRLERVLWNVWCTLSQVLFVYDLLYE